MFQKLRLSGSQLKMLALITMTIDHIGFIFFPQVWWLRAIGRLAFPIFAYMIAEGCRYTRRRMRYWGSIALLALVCDAAEMIAEGSLYQSVMTTFTLSVGMIYALDWAMRGENRREQLLRSLLSAGAVLLAFFLCELLPLLLWTTDYHVDYRFSGALLPVLVYVGKRRETRLALAALGILATCLEFGGVQWYALLALLPLALYDGTRGRHAMKWLFYLYYPLHLALLWGIHALF